MVLDSLSLLQCMKMLLQSLVVPFNILLLGFHLFHRLGMCLGFSLLMVTLDTPKGGATHLSLLVTITFSTRASTILWIILTCCRPKDTKLRPDDWHHCRIGTVDPGAVSKRTSRSSPRKQYQKKFLCIRPRPEWGIYSWRQTCSARLATWRRHCMFGRPSRTNRPWNSWNTWELQQCLEIRN